MQTEQACPTCKGTGNLEYEEERASDDTWRRRVGKPDPLWPQLARELPSLCRYAKDACEVCKGAGTITVETFRGVAIF